MKSGTPELVINTGPVIALVAATGGLEWLAELYQTVWLPEAVYSELSAGGPGAPEPSRVQAAAKVVRILPQSGELPAELARQLDPGEAWVIQSALAQKVETVAIDEKVGRRVARIYGLQVTGSLGILIRARRMGVIPNLETSSPACMTMASGCRQNYGRTRSKPSTKHPCPSVGQVNQVRPFRGSE